jgi:hypothetical protein
VATHGPVEDIENAHTALITASLGNRSLFGDLRTDLSSFYQLLARIDAALRAIFVKQIYFSLVNRCTLLYKFVIQRVYYSLSV